MIARCMLSPCEGPEIGTKVRVNMWMRLRKLQMEEHMLEALKVSDTTLQFALCEALESGVPIPEFVCISDVGAENWPVQCFQRLQTIGAIRDPFHHIFCDLTPCGPRVIHF